MNKKFIAGIIVIALVVLVGSFAIVKADFGQTLLEMIANKAGLTVGDNINQKLDESGALNAPVGDLAFGAIPGLDKALENVVQGSFIDASTTIVSFYSPFLAATSSASDVVVKGAYPNAFTVASSTVDLGRLNITGVATSSFTVACGASGTNGANGPGTQAYALISSDSVATSTKAVIENDISSSYGSQIGGGSVSKIMLGPTFPYLVCKVTTNSAAGSGGAFTEATNTFDGKYLFRVIKTLF